MMPVENTRIFPAFVVIVTHRLRKLKSSTKRSVRSTIFIMEISSLHGMGHWGHHLIVKIHVKIHACQQE